MNNEQFVLFESPFRALAQPFLERVRQVLIEAGVGDFTPIHTIDKDIDRGLGFEMTGEFDGERPSIDLMLIDADDDRESEEDPPMVAIKLDCSSYISGILLTAYNITSPSQITEETLPLSEASAAAEAAVREWQALGLLPAGTQPERSERQS